MSTTDTEQRKTVSSNQTMSNPSTSQTQEPTRTRDARVDVAISGASFAGIVLALALRQSLGQDLKIALIDTKPELFPANDQPDARAFAIAAGSKHLLDYLGLWTDIEAASQPVTTIELTDSSLDDGVRPTLVTYDNHVNDGEPATYIVPARTLEATLAAKLRTDTTLQLIRPARISAFTADQTSVAIAFADRGPLTTSLLVGADGRRSATRTAADIEAMHVGYDQTAIVTTISHTRPHEGRAIQHFLPGGPFALLPLPNNQCCVTWSEDADEAAHILALSDDDFHTELDKRVGGKLGTLTVVGPRQSWPLSLDLAKDYVAERFALIGDAAHGVHPIAGQGLNLALRDVAALTEVIVDTARLGVDIGSLASLRRYERWRRFDSFVSALSYHGLNKLFSNDVTVLRAVRDAGLGAVDRMTSLKEYFVKEAAGLSGDVPRLLKGEAL